MSSKTTPKLLIYLPCYDDYELSLTQAERLAHQYSLLSASSTVSFSLKIVLSVNSDKYPYKPRSNSNEGLEIFSYGHGISGDVNISLGFYSAICEDSDFLWILSSNNPVTNEALATIERMLIHEPTVDALVAGNVHHETPISVTSVFSADFNHLRFGLISSVVYRVNSIRRDIDMAIRMNWTGWSQLAVQEASCLRLGGLKILAIPEEKLHVPQSLSGSKFKSAERLNNRVKYAHSFFGSPLLIISLYGQDRDSCRKRLNEWLGNNWYLRNFYAKGLNYSNTAGVASTNNWLIFAAQGAVSQASYFYRVLFFLGRFMPYTSLMFLRDRLIHS